MNRREALGLFLCAPAVAACAAPPFSEAATAGPHSIRAGSQFGKTAQLEEIPPDAVCVALRGRPVLVRLADGTARAVVEHPEGHWMVRA